MSCKQGDVQNGTKKVYYDGTNQIMQTVEYKNGKKNGFLTEFYRNGTVSAKQFFVNDTINGTAYEYYENGNPATERNYKMGVKEGVWKHFNKKGMLYEEKTYKDSQLDGPSNKFTYLSGKPLERLNYSKGRQEGKQEYFYNNGKPKSSYTTHGFGQLTDLQEWEETGEKTDTDIKVKITERNQLMMGGAFTLIAGIDDIASDDKVFFAAESAEGVIIPLQMFKRVGNHFELELYVQRGGYIMRKQLIVVKRKTGQGNTVMKKINYNLSVNNY
jgi:antitoxin component YwqK of YwqJK toxin-antitoxin module